MKLLKQQGTLHIPRACKKIEEQWTIHHYKAPNQVIQCQSFITRTFSDRRLVSVVLYGQEIILACNRKDKVFLKGNTP
jgi:hypothetical protein